MTDCPHEELMRMIERLCLVIEGSMQEGSVITTCPQIDQARGLVKKYRQKLAQLVDQEAGR